MPGIDFSHVTSLQAKNRIIQSPNFFYLADRCSESRQTHKFHLQGGLHGRDSQATFGPVN